MVKRKIIKIEDDKCNGCGLCIPNCPEGALQVIDGKARLVSDLFCDGLGACIGYCPQGAITIEKRPAQKYDERKVMENIVKQGKNVIRAHLEHLKGHNEEAYLSEAINFLIEKGIANPLEEKTGSSAHKHTCPGSREMDLRQTQPDQKGKASYKAVSRLANWPVQIKLAPINASYFKDADLLIAADCVAFSYANFHEDFLRNKILLMGCPKLDDAALYQDKITQILKNNNIKSIACVHMEVPCCFGLVSLVKTAISSSGKDIPFKEINISIKGEILK